MRARDKCAYTLWRLVYSSVHAIRWLPPTRLDARDTIVSATTCPAQDIVLSWPYTLQVSYVSSVENIANHYYTAYRRILESYSS